MNPTPTPPPRYGLSQLSQIQLSEHDLAFLKSLGPRFGGSPPWAARKEAMTRELLALAQLTDRLKFHWFDVTTDFRVLFDLRVTVPCLPDPRGELQVASRATLGLTYREEAMTTPQPGYAFISIIQPRAVWLANVASDFPQPLCLGAKLDAGIPVKELVLGAYLALALQSYQFNERDASGLLNRDAAIFWQHSPQRIPLSKEPFLTHSLPNTHEPKP